MPIAFNSFVAISDIIDDNRNGILIEPFDLKEYEKQLCRLMDKPQLQEELSANATKDIK